MSSSTSQTTSRAGRLTLPVEKGMDAQVAELLERLQADAVRNSDGTELPEIVNELATKDLPNLLRRARRPGLGPEPTPGS